MKKLISFEKKTIVSAVSILILLTALAQGQNLFESDGGSGNIYELTPGGMPASLPPGCQALAVWLLIARAICLWRMKLTSKFINSSLMVHAAPFTGGNIGSF